MEPLAIATFTGGVIGQIGFLVVRYKPFFDFICKIVACIRNPRPPPPLSEALMESIEELNGAHH
ncbi:hypothetical protein AMTR_s00061p00194090 [Amborella trichopoda]|uniref:Uncharacterized protein n=1 Tax=Amborella trichopoda TaxID=13333 RepID=U5D0S8_AMBTC|nr:hypothetical protein AMTR_s00061p00194090 [Amborella trichopoda]